MIKRLLKRYADFLRTVADSLEGIDDDSNEELKPDSTEYTDEERRLIEYTTPYFEKTGYIPVWFRPTLHIIAQYLPVETGIRFHEDFENGLFERIKYPFEFKIHGGRVIIKEYCKMHSALIVYRIMY
jgi:hypothetical protein